MNRELQFGDFLKTLVALFHRKKISMPFENERPWHELFYTLKKTEANDKQKPIFFHELWFDWDGPYPKCRELSTFLHALHWNAGVSAFNPRFTNITLTDEIADLWLSYYNELEPRTKMFVETALQEGKTIFSEMNTR